MTIYLDNQEVTDEILVDKWLEYNGQIIYVAGSAINHDTGHLILHIAPAIRQKIRDFAYIELLNDHYFQTVDVPKHTGDVIYKGYAFDSQVVTVANVFNNTFCSYDIRYVDSCGHPSQRRVTPFEIVSVDY
mgnify:CR=1 FL=1